ncbi:unnamed protein product [Orchesella dallaii]|uniref:10 kDa heat shock protein, mitochondrial n=1 Tax=Orchesella dallaii TaxID=48710 RepID=A0ABP1QUH1_9HEXA
MASAARVAVESIAKRVRPLFDRVLVEKAEPIAKTKGGLYIPEKAQGRVVHGTIVATGPGARNEVGFSSVTLTLNVGHVTFSFNTVKLTVLSETQQR